MKMRNIIMMRARGGLSRRLLVFGVSTAALIYLPTKISVSDIFPKMQKHTTLCQGDGLSSSNPRASLLLSSELFASIPELVKSKFLNSGFIRFGKAAFVVRIFRQGHGPCKVFFMFPLDTFWLTALVTTK